MQRTLILPEAMVSRRPIPGDTVTILNEHGVEAIKVHAVHVDEDGTMTIEGQS